MTPPLDGPVIAAAIDAVVERICVADAWTRVSAHGVARVSARQVAQVNPENRFEAPFLGRIEIWLFEELEARADADVDDCVRWVFDNWKAAQQALAKRVVARAYARLREDV